MRVPAQRAGEVVDVLCDAFHGYPVMRWVLDRRAPGYDARIRTLVEFFLAARQAWDEPVLGVEAEGAIVGAALVSGDRRGEEPEALTRKRQATWDTLGKDALARYTAFGDVFAPFRLEEPHVHLHMIGVRRAAAGRGVGRRLLDAVHAISARDPQSCGVTLSTETPDNVPLYEHMGYRVVGHARVSDALETWAMFRPDPESGGTR